MRYPRIRKRPRFAIIAAFAAALILATAGAAAAAPSAPAPSQPAPAITTGIAAAAAPSAPTSSKRAPVITTYTAPHQHGVFYPALGSDGNIWDITIAGTVVRILTHAPYTVTEFTVPGGFYLRDIIAGPDGNLWFTDQRGTYDGEQQAGEIGRITPSGKITEFQLPNSQSVPTPIGIISAHGSLYFTEDCKASACYPGGNNLAVGRITPFGSDARIQASVTTIVPKTTTPCAAQACDTQPWGITTGPDDSLWIAAGASVDQLSLRPGNKLTRYPVPGAAKYAALDLTTGTDGNVWFTGETPNTPLGRITPKGKITMYPVQAPGGEGIGIRTGPDGNLWFAAGSTGGTAPNGLIGTFSPHNPRRMTYYTVPNGAVPYGFANGPCDNTIWFTDTGGNPGPGIIGSIQLPRPANRYQSMLDCKFSKFGNAQGQ